VGRHDHGGGARGVEQCLELGIAEERELTGTRVLEAGCAGDLDGPVTFETALQLRSEVTESQGGGSISRAPEGEPLDEGRQVVQAQMGRDLVQPVQTLRGRHVDRRAQIGERLARRTTPFERVEPMPRTTPREIVSDDTERKVVANKIWSGEEDEQRG